MANVFLNIPVPVTDGVGAAVDVSAMGKTKSFVIGGSFRACVNVEYAIGDAPTDWAPLATFLQAGNLTIDIACQWIRAVTTEAQSGAANLDVGSNDAGIVFATLPGDGTSTDISALPGFKTVVVPSLFVGTIEVSEDGVSWAQAFSFQTGAAAGQSREIYGQFARVNPVGAALPVHIAGSDNGGGGGAGSVMRMWSIPDTGPIALTGGQPISTFSFTPVLGKRYVFQTWFTVTAQADNPSVPIQIGGQLVQDPGGKAAVGFGIGETIAAAEEDQDVEVCVSFQGSIIGDGLTHTYGTVMLFPSGGSAFATRSGLGSSGITIFEDDDRIPS